eukprot:8340510-Alexandrium_andersonii.AAC.1
MRRNSRATTARAQRNTGHARCSYIYSWYALDWRAPELLPSGPLRELSAQRAESKEREGGHAAQ